MIILGICSEDKRRAPCSVQNRRKTDIQRVRVVLPKFTPADTSFSNSPFIYSRIRTSLPWQLAQVLPDRIHLPDVDGIDVGSATFGKDLDTQIISIGIDQAAEASPTVDIDFHSTLIQKDVKR